MYSLVNSGCGSPRQPMNRDMISTMAITALMPETTLPVEREQAKARPARMDEESFRAFYERTARQNRIGATLCFESQRISRAITAGVSGAEPMSHFRKISRPRRTLLKHAPTS